MPDHEGLDVLIAKINAQLSELTVRVATDSKNNLGTRNVLAETILAGLLNLMEDWKLVNANRIRPNHPAVDLVDPEKRIAVQVTSTNDIKKIKHTLEEFQAHGLAQNYDRLYVVIISTDSPTPAMKEKTIPDIFSGETDIWNIPTLQGRMMDLGIDKLEAIHSYLTRELGRWDSAGRRLYLPPENVLREGFLGREWELAEIQRKLDSSRQPVILSGLGGIGKTQLAARFGSGYSGGAVYFTLFKGSFRATVLDMYAHVKPQPGKMPPEEEQFDTVMKLLGRCTAEDLLIIDNVDADSGTLGDLLKDEVFTKIRNTGLRILLTTRFEHRGGIGISVLEETELMDIFRRHEVDIPEDQMRTLIRAVNGHTMTIDLIARTLADNWVPVSPEEMLTAFKNSTLAREDFPEVESDHGEGYEQKQIYAHLKALFNVAKIPDAERAILCPATLLPEEGMDLRLFRDCLPEDIRGSFPKLGQRGWLLSDKKLVRIHPVIRLVCREELKPDDETCGDFLVAIWARWNRKQYDAELHRQRAELFSNASDHLPDSIGDWALVASGFWNQLGNANQALEYCLKTVTIRENVLPENHSDLATVYNNVGISYGTLGEYKKALEYQLRAQAIEEKNLPENHPDLATVYNNVGSTYSNLGNPQKALKLKLKALAIRERNLPENHPDLAASYNNVGFAFSNLGDPSKALKYQLKALAISEKILPGNHPDLGTCYNNVGSTYSKLGDHKKALEYLLQALVIREKFLPKNHPDLAASYNNMGFAYDNLGDHEKALGYNLKAMEILEEILPESHPDLAKSYNNVGTTYGNLGDHQTEMEYLLKSMTIRENVLPNDHPDLAASYNNLGCTYGELGDYSTAIWYLTKALTINQNSLPNGHPHTEATRKTIAYYQEKLEES